MSEASQFRNVVLPYHVIRGANHIIRKPEGSTDIVPRLYMVLLEREDGEHVIWSKLTKKESNKLMSRLKTVMKGGVDPKDQE